MSARITVGLSARSGLPKHLQRGEIHFLWVGVAAVTMASEAYRHCISVLHILTEKANKCTFVLTKLKGLLKLPMNAKLCVNGSDVVLIVWYTNGVFVVKLK